MTLFHPFASLEIHQEVWWKRWWSCLFSRFSFACQARYSWSCLVVLLTSVLIVSCSDLNFGSNTVATPEAKPAPTPATINLSKVSWCGQPVMVFRDLADSGTPGVASGSATTLTAWTQVKPILGFTVYLPTTLPHGSCLVSASGTVHDPILGGNFVIGYVLPDHSSLTLSQAPQRSQNATFQCSSTSTNGTKITLPTPVATPQGPLQICSGSHGSTNIVFSARGDTHALQQFFNALQPDVNWIPAS